MNKTKNSTARYMAKDQYGVCYHNIIHPRKELLEYFGRKHADKMYVDGKDGKRYHVGYVIAEHWLRLFKVEPMRVLCH